MMAGLVYLSFVHLLVLASGASLNANGGQRFSSKHDHLNSNTDDFHLLRPYRSTPEGEFLSHELSTNFEEDQHDFHRVRRHAENSRTRRSVSEEEPNEATQKVFHFSMNAFGTKITINVTRDTRLVSPNFRVNRYMSDGSIIVERPRMNCFYRGNVIGSDRSSVAISNCHGMSGMIKTNQDEYFIEPLDTSKEQYDTYNYTDGNVHIMYRRRKPNDAQTDAPSETLNLRNDVMKTAARRRAHLSPNVNIRRSRRDSTSTTSYYVETMITVDHSMHSFHGKENISLYVLTLMNIVNMAYDHPSLDADIEFVIASVNLLDEELSSRLVVGNESTASLANTCGFARRSRTVVLDDGSTQHFDHSIFLTRTHFGPAGFAPVGFMCHLTYSCSLVKDDGLQSAFVIAHEAGHVFGMEHDGENVCSDDEYGMSIMAAVVISTSKDMYWSKCSRNELHSFLPQWTCLLNNPPGGTRAVNITMPGRAYSMDDQCRFQFGHDYGKCHHTDVDYCAELYCTGPGLDGGCLKKGPPLDGTSCGKNMECFKEECVPAEPVDGNWSGWQSWEPCSYSCGLGVRARRRLCNNPPPSARGRDCVGDAIQYELCNAEVCPDGPTDKHQHQCNKLGKRQEQTLLAYQNNDPRTTCRLSCISDDTGEIFVSDDDVRDGTPATYEYPELICVDGDVKSVGCDIELGSAKFWDNCGVCDGKNESCVEVTTPSVHSDAKRNKYKKLMTLSPGMWNLKVTKSVDSSHFLALKIEETGRYILNKAKQQSHSHAFIESGVRFVYKTDGQHESLTAKGPIPFRVYLMAFATRDSRPMSYNIIHYEESENETIDPSPAPLPEYLWEDLGWTECNRECDGGYSYHRYQCTRTRDNRRVKHKICGHADYNPKAERIVCNKHACGTDPESSASVSTTAAATTAGPVTVTVRHQWEAGTWSECSATCGTSAVKNRAIQCLQITGSRQEMVEDGNCSSEDRPRDVKGCGLDHCVGEWLTGTWSECSATCGPGVKSRNVTCAIPTGALKSDYLCDSGIQPPSAKKCEITTCPEKTCQPRTESILCDPARFETYCRFPKYSQVCCTTCEEQRARLTVP